MAAGSTAPWITCLAMLSAARAFAQQHDDSSQAARVKAWPMPEAPTRPSNSTGRQNSLAMTAAPVFEVPGDIVLDGYQTECLYQSEGASSDLPLSGDPFTIEFWVKPDLLSPLTSSLQHKGTIVYWGTPHARMQSNQVFLRPGMSNGYGYVGNQWFGSEIIWAGSAPLLPYPGLSDGEFHHVAVMYDPQDSGARVRTILVDFTPSARSIWPNSEFEPLVNSKEHFCIGMLGGGSEWWSNFHQFAGTIRGLRIWKSALTLSELQASASTTATTPASAIGDPHLQNVHGQRFDLTKQGKHVLINIPRGDSAEHALLRVQADARQLGGQCTDMYFQELNVTGSWAESKRTGGYHYDVSESADEAPQWIRFGKVELKVAHGRTDDGLRYLNVYAKHLGHTGFTVGGLLGEDDHEDVSVPGAECMTRVSLQKIRARMHGHMSPAASAAQGAFA